MYNRRYDRKTIILKQETDSFSRQNAKTAVCTVEIKNGRGKIIIKGIMPDFCHVYLIANDDGGNIVFNAGDIKDVSFDADNVGGSGNKIEAFDVIVVGGRRNDGQFLSDVYVGYANKRREWRQSIKPEKQDKQKDGAADVCETDTDAANSAGLPEHETEEENETIPEFALLNEETADETRENALDGIPQNISKDKILVWGVPKIADAADMKKDGNYGACEDRNKDEEENGGRTETPETDIHDTFKNIVRNFNTQMKKLESMGVLSLSEILAINGGDCNGENERETEVKSEDTGKEYWDYKNKSVKDAEKKELIKDTEHAEECGNDSAVGVSFGDDIEELFNNNPVMNPFDNDDYRWVRICPEEMWLLPIDDISVNTSSFVICSDRKYKHLMLGRDSRSLLLAVPQAFSQKDRKAAMSLGFVDFWQNKGQEQKEGCYGYWIRKIK